MTACELWQMLDIRSRWNRTTELSQRRRLRPLCLFPFSQSLPYCHVPSQQYWTGHSSKNTDITKFIKFMKSCLSIIQTSSFKCTGEFRVNVPAEFRVPGRRVFHKVVSGGIKRSRDPETRECRGSPVTMWAAVFNICRSPAELQDVPGASAKSLLLVHSSEPSR